MLGLLAAIALTVLPGSSAPVHVAVVPCPDAEAVASTTAREARAVRCLLNAERTARGLPRLHVSRPLRVAASRHTRNMVRRGFFDHVSPGGSTPESRAHRAGYTSRYIAETLAWSDGPDASPAGTVARWMASPGHRAAILDPQMRAVGIGVVQGSPIPGEPGGTTITADYGSA